MAIPILVTTPVRSFGELIQQALEDTGLYAVTLVHSNDQALERVKAQPINIAVIDFDLDEKPAELVSNLLTIKPALKIIAMKDETNRDSSVFEGLALAQCLTNSFYLPDLFDALADITTAGAPTPPAISKTASANPATKRPKPQTNYKTRHSPEWLQDVDRAAQHLTRLSLESSAQAALITRGEQLWAYAGQLPQPAAAELAESVSHYWARDGGSDLARFIRLKAIHGEYMLYATGLGGEYVLALAFETEIPFSEIRAQASKLAKGLAAPPAETKLTQHHETLQAAETQISIQAKPDAPLDAHQAEIPPDWRPAQDPAPGRQAFFEELLSAVNLPEPDSSSQIAESLPQPIQPAANEKPSQKSLAELANILDTADHPLGNEIDLDHLIAKTLEEELPEIEGFTADFGEFESPAEILDSLEETPSEAIPAFLTDVSLEDNLEPEAENLPEPAAPAPGNNSTPYPIPESLMELIAGQGPIATSEKAGETTAESTPDDETRPKPISPAPEKAPPAAISNEIDTQATTTPITIRPVARQEHADEAARSSLDTGPTLLQDDDQPPKSKLNLNDFEPVSASVYNLTYGCVLIPRLPQHHLVGDLAMYLNQWVTQLSLAFGWRLEHLATRPGYLHWVASVPPATSPGHMVRNIREHTSQRIFTELPGLSRDNPSGDFWAPGYLIVNEKAPLSHRIVQEFIRKTRIRQGNSTANQRS